MAYDLPARIDNDGFAAVAGNTSRIIGQLIKFTKGTFILGRNDGKMNGAVLQALELLPCWQKWGDDRRLVDARYPDDGPLAASIDDINDLSGIPGTWKPGRLLYLADLDDGSEYTFTTNSSGGIRAVDDLATKVIRMRRRRPGAFPVIRLDATTYDHREYGEVDKPVFPVQSWVTENGEPYPEKTQEEPRRLPPNGRTPVNDLDDDIPY